MTSDEEYFLISFDAIDWLWAESKVGDIFMVFGSFCGSGGVIAFFLLSFLFILFFWFLVNGIARPGILLEWL